MADILRLIDAATEQASEPLNCGYCGNPIRADSASLDFCGATCQRAWSFDQSDGHVPDLHRGYLEQDFDVNVRFPEAIPSAMREGGQLLDWWSDQHHEECECRLCILPQGRWRQFAYHAQMNAYMTERDVITAARQVTLFNANGDPLMVR